MGLVIRTGISIGTVFALFVMPVRHLFLAAEHGRRETAEEAIHAAARAEPQAYKSGKSRRPVFLLSKAKYLPFA